MMGGMDLFFFDSETTGFGSCHIVEGAFAFTPHIAGTFRTPEIRTFRVKPPIPIDPDATRVHGISDEDVAALPAFATIPEYEMLREILPSCLLIAHNAPFDRAVLEREGLSVPNVIDTRRVAKAVFPDVPNHQLQTLRRHLGINLEAKAHSAAGDVAVLIGLFILAQSEIMRIHGDSAEEALSRMARY